MATPPAALPAPPGAPQAQPPAPAPQPAQAQGGTSRRNLLFGLGGLLGAGAAGYAANRAGWFDSIGGWFSSYFGDDDKKKPELSGAVTIESDDHIFKYTHYGDCDKSHIKVREKTDPCCDDPQINNHLSDLEILTQGTDTKPPELAQGYTEGYLRDSKGGTFSRLTEIVNKCDGNDQHFKVTYKVDFERDREDNPIEGTAYATGEIGKIEYTDKKNGLPTETLCCSDSKVLGRRFENFKKVIECYQEKFDKYEEFVVERQETPDCQDCINIPKVESVDIDNPQPSVSTEPTFSFTPNARRLEPTGISQLYQRMRQSME